MDNNNREELGSIHSQHVPLIKPLLGKDTECKCKPAFEISAFFVRIIKRGHQLDSGPGAHRHGVNVVGAISVFDLGHAEESMNYESARQD